MKVFGYPPFFPLEDNAIRLQASIGDSVGFRPSREQKAEAKFTQRNPALRVIPPRKKEGKNTHTQVGKERGREMRLRFNEARVKQTRP